MAYTPYQYINFNIQDLREVIILLSALYSKLFCIYCMKLLVDQHFQIKLKLNLNTVLGSGLYYPFNLL